MLNKKNGLSAYKQRKIMWAFAVDLTATQSSGLSSAMLVAAQSRNLCGVRRMPKRADVRVAIMASQLATGNCRPLRASQR